MRVIFSALRCQQGHFGEPNLYEERAKSGLSLISSEQRIFRSVGVSLEQLRVLGLKQYISFVKKCPFCKRKAQNKSKLIFNGGILSFQSIPGFEGMLPLCSSRLGFS